MMCYIHERSAYKNLDRFHTTSLLERLNDVHQSEFTLHSTGTPIVEGCVPLAPGIIIIVLIFSDIPT
jgi:hypothetical protein